MTRCDYCFAIVSGMDNASTGHAMSCPARPLKPGEATPGHYGLWQDVLALREEATSQLRDLSAAHRKESRAPSANLYRLRRFVEALRTARKELT